MKMMQLGMVTTAVGLLVRMGGLRSAQAAVVYSQDFESPVSLVTNSPGAIGGFAVVADDAGGSGWQIQGGGGGPGPVAVGGIDNNGVGGSQGLFANWDNSPISRSAGILYV